MADHKPGPQRLTIKGPPRSPATTTLYMEVFEYEDLLSSLGSIASILRVATEIQNKRPRVAYLCRCYAFEKAHRLDPSSNGRGVREFKIALLQRLERDNALSLASRVKETDAREIESFYQQYYEHYVRALDKGEQADRAQLDKAYQTLGVLFELLCAVNKTEKVEEASSSFFDRAQHDKAYQTAGVLFEVMCTVNTEKVEEVASEVKASVVDAIGNTSGLN